MILDSRISYSRRIVPILSLTGLLLIVLYFVVSGLQSSHRIVPGFIDHIQSGKSHVEEIYQSVVGTAKHGDVPASQPSAVASTWEYVPSQHARNYGLSDEQCNIAFPNFYHEIDRATAWWAERGGILEGDLDIGWQNRSGMMRLLIHDQQLYVIDKNYAVARYDVPRALALLHSINRAIITSPAPLPDIEFTMNLGDWPDDPSNTHPVWVLSRSTPEVSKWIMPDFGYWSWPLAVIGEYNSVRDRIRRMEPSWSDKIDKLVWRGSTSTNKLRTALVEASEGKEWSDVKPVHWEMHQGVERPVVGDGTSKALTIPEHCNYRFVAHTEGNSYSGRTKYLFNCNSVSIMHTQTWVEPQSHLYRGEGPDQNVVFVEPDYSNLDEVMNNLRSNETEARRIATNALNTFRDRYLTPAAQACFWRQLMHAWDSVQMFTPQLYDGVVDSHSVGDGVDQLPRGVSYESFVADLIDPDTLVKPIVTSP